MNKEHKPQIIKQDSIIIQCYTIPSSHHAFPLLHIIGILAKNNSLYKISFHTSLFWIQKYQKEYREINMVPINDGISQEEHNKLVMNGPLAFQNYLFMMHNQYFQRKKNKPHLIICDLFEGEAIKYAVKNQIKLIINCPLPYAYIHHHIGYPTLSRAFAFGGHTVISPTPVSGAIHKIFKEYANNFRYYARIFINTAIGLEQPCITPPHHTITGLLTNPLVCKTSLESGILNWMKQWKIKGKKKFLYISFGDEVELSQKFVNQMVKVIKTVQYPTFWNIKHSFKEQLKCSLIYHKQQFPQQTIISLPEVVAFISRCSWNYLTKAIDNQTPLICIPGFMDQLYNSDLVRSKKIGVLAYEPKALSFQHIFSPDIQLQKVVSSITQVVQNEGYLKNICKMNELCRRYNTQNIISDAVKESLKFGHEHLIDKSYDQIGSRLKSETIKYVLIVLMMFFSMISVFRGAGK